MKTIPSRLGIPALAIGLVLIVLTGCNRSEPTGPSGPSGTAPPAREDDLAAARKSFVTKLEVRGPAPQRFKNEQPPRGVREVEYPSGGLKLKGWLSAAPTDGKRHPAVVFLHGGFAFAAEDWADAAPLAAAGFVLFAPTFRGENGNPGAYESFFGEVDDALAAGRYVSALPYVDDTRVFVAGHSSGAVLTCLTAMMPSPYKAAAALDGSVDMESWAKFSPGPLVPYNPSDPEEVRLRNPMAFVASLRCPLTLYAGEGARAVNEALAARAQRLGKRCDLVLVHGDHAAMVAPAVQKAIAQFRSAPEK
jgi:dipeptidyl aminopeptidase/acylaminoacyl peptidase